MQTIQCPKCATAGDAPQGLSMGESLTCPKCGAVFVPAMNWFDSAVPMSDDSPDWVRTETERFQAYVAGELARLERTRRELADFESQAERRVLGKRIELNRVQTKNAARTAELGRREKDATEREAMVSARTTTQDERERAISERESHRSRLEAEAADLGRLVGELRPAVERLQLRRTEAESIRSDLATRQSALDRRMVEVGRMELALQHRLDELDELEVTLRAELEERERNLERQRRSLEEEARTARSHAGVSVATPPPRAWLQTVE